MPPSASSPAPPAKWASKSPINFFAQSLFCAATGYISFSSVMFATAQTDDHVFLVGRPPLGEFLGFIRTMSIDGQTADQGQLANEWRHANDHVSVLERTEAGIADGLQVAQLPASLTQLTEQVRAKPSFQKTFRTIP